MTRILVLNRMHLDEWPAGRVEAILAGLRGHPSITGFSRSAPGPGERNQRGYDGNITECFPGRPDGNAEQRDAWQVTRLARHADLILDIHGTRDENETFAFYGPPPSRSRGQRSALVRGVAGLLGSEHAVVMRAPHPAATLPGYVGWDLGPGSPVLDDLADWLTALAVGWIPPARPVTEYHYVAGVRAADAIRLGLARRYPPFGRLPGQALRELGLRSPGYAFSWNADLYGGGGYWGEVVVPWQDRLLGSR